MIEGITIAVVVLLTVTTVFAFIHAHSKRIAAEDHAASNSRVLREFKRMTIHQPEKIIDNPRRNH